METPHSSFESILESDAIDAHGRSTVEPSGIDSFVQQIKETADKLKRDGAGRGDAKMLSTALKELRYCFKLFSAYRGKRKVTVFGSARTKPTHPAYLAAVEFGRIMAKSNYMVITGAGGGIMEAGHVGAGRENSFGLNILLPFEQSANPVVLDDPKLMNMRYFFTRKLMFLKESDAIALFPGGFGTHDEAFETLTLIQTGKSHIFPIVLVDEPGGNYWKLWEEFVDKAMLERGYISTEDKALYRITDSVQEATEEIIRFYRVYHSMRYVKGELVLRLKRQLSEATMEQIRRDFQDITLKPDAFVQTEALPAELNEPHLVHLPRLKFPFNRHNHGRLRQLIDFINRAD